ncbi:MAG TPA: class F sortase [Dehalococcoidia bacterium]|nr:class F sortase [Dehalococcoidia bacterium]
MLLISLRCCALGLVVALTLALLGEAGPAAHAATAQVRQDVDYPTPIRLQIPSLHIDAPIELLGVDDLGGMESPASPDDVGWFAPGFLPGTPGNAVIAGHVDWVDRAAIFWFVRDLQPGDEVDVLFDDGSFVSFAVDQVVDYPDGDVPMDEVFGPSDQSHLNLITCDGVFNRATHNYDHRTVVYTTQVPPVLPGPEE